MGHFRGEDSPATGVLRQVEVKIVLGAFEMMAESSLEIFYKLILLQLQYFRAFS